MIGNRCTATALVTVAALSLAPAHAFAQTSAVAAPSSVAAPADAAPALTTAALTTAALTTPALTTPALSGAAAIGTRVSAALSTAGSGTIGAAVDVDGLGVALRRNSTAALKPASNQKSFTAATALLTMPSTRRLHTTVAAVAPTSGTGRVAGSIWLVAGGDPHLTTSQLRGLARAVRAAGVREVTGDLRLDDSRYDSARRVPSWKASFMPGQSGPLSALALDRNTWRTDATYLADPALPAAVRFRALLKAEGVVVRGVVRRSIKPATAHRVARISSAPLSTLAARVLKPSDNFAAELMLKEIGRYNRGVGSTASGLAVVRSVLAARGVAVGSNYDGSGLSYLNRKTPAGELSLMRAIRRSSIAATFRAALPVACVDGTLRLRMCGTAAAGNARAKTGTLNGVRTLNGTVRTRSGRTATFAFMINSTTDSLRARAAIDRATAVLAASAE